MKLSELSRRSFIKKTGAIVGGSMIAAVPFSSMASSKRSNEKKKIALVGTGVRAIGTYGKQMLEEYDDHLEMIGICDSNPGRLRYAHQEFYPNVSAFTDLDEMLSKTSPDWLIVTTWDWEHHNNIVTGLKHGCNIICEKPLTIDEHKAEAILAAEKKYNKEIAVTFNLRFPPAFAKVKELLMDGVIGEINTADFHWNITRNHLVQYLRRWHGEADRGGTLWVHKSTHHFDLVNWWLDSDPVEVFAYSDLKRFGPRGSFRGANCRNCAHTQKCPHYWDITRNEHLTKMYVENEHYDGYIRDNCVFRNQIDIYEQHSALVKYANGVTLNYSLTADTDHSGIWIAFNGSKGRLEGRVGGWPDTEGYREWILKPLGEEPQSIVVPPADGGHWGGDALMKDKLFKYPEAPDPLQQTAGTRDGVMSMIIGTAARKSSESGKPVRIEDLISIKPLAKRPV